MANNANNTSAAKPNIAGAIYKAPKGTTVPTDATTALNAAFVCLGYVSEDGVTNSNTRTSNDFKAWGGDTVLSEQTDYKDTFKFKLIEVLNKDVLKTVHGSANVTGDDIETGLTIKANSKELDESSWVIDMIMRDNVLDRFVIPTSKISEIGDVVYSSNDLVAYEVTVTAFPDASGNTHYEYLKKSAASE